MEEFHPILIETIYREDLYSPFIPPMVVIDQPWLDIGKEEKVLLQKILTAIGQSLDSVTIKQQPSLDLSQWAEKPKRLIYFGKAINGISQYEVVEADGVAIVTSENLTDLLGNDVSRKKLWQALKKQFSI